MYELQQTEFQKIDALYAPLKHYLTIDAVLQHTTPGRVWADDTAVPQTAVVWANHRVYVGGEGSEELVAFFAGEFQPAATAAGIEGFTLYLPPGWSRDGKTLFPDAYPTPRPRLYFRQDARQRSWEVSVPDGFELRPVDAALVEDRRITNPDYLIEEMLSERPSIDEFLAHSFGCCLIHNHEIIGWCLSEYNTGPRCELGIATAAPFQRRGFATLMATATIRQALAQGVYDIGWLCWADNDGSVATARKLGFQQTFAGTAYNVIFDPVLALGVRGNHSLHEEQFAAALDSYEQALQHGAAPDWLYWNTAVTCLKLDQPEKAFAYLHQAIDAGLTDQNLFQNSPHWQSWHKTAEWETVRQRLDLKVSKDTL